MKYLLLEKHVERDHLGHEISVAARTILFDEDPETKLKSVEDIREAPTAWDVVDFSIRDNEWLQIDGLGIFINESTTIDLCPDLQFKTREVRVRRVLEKLEAHYKTGLDISKPVDTFKRDNRGRFAQKEVTRDLL